MALTIGARLGPYEVTAQIGAGGMGEVYRATDTNLKRRVAIKILPEAFAQDAERLARIQREAEVLASLNHPHIAAIYGLERTESTTALIMELVEGRTLAERIGSAGPLPIDDVLTIAKQIADALEAAHEQGIVHRDLKPANIKVKDDGTVKVLDFGLAKIAQPIGALAGGATWTGAVGASQSPTITTPAMTMAGVILGTASYMSPEQAKGRPADKRSDLWGFGCVLYEMLTATRAFDGDDVSETLAFVLTKHPDLSALPKSTPTAVRRLLRRCLEKDRKRRLADASDARLEIEEALTAAAQEIPGTNSRPIPYGLRRWVLLGAGAFVLGGLLTGAMMRRSQTSAAPPAVVRFALPLADGQQFFENGNQILAISPDGTRIVFAANRRLYMRRLSELEARPVAGTETASGQVGSPVFSPDGQSIAFVSGRPPSIKRIAATGGAAVTICTGCGTLGTMSWDSSGIVFAQAGQGLPVGFAGERAREGPHRIMRVAADGGEPQLLFAVTDGIPFDVQVLPGGDTVLFGLVNRPLQIAESADASPVEAQIVAQSVTSGERKVLVPSGSAPRYLPSGHLLYARDGIMFARRFDLERLEAISEETPVVEGVGRPTFVGASTSVAYFDVSASGSLLYIPGPITRLVPYDLGILDPQKGVEPLKLQPRAYRYPRVSHDGKWIAVEATDGQSEDIWLYERSGRSAMRRLTSSGRNRYPLWSSDSTFVAFQSEQDGNRGLFRQRADGSGTAERLTTPDAGTSHVPNSWARDGRSLFYEVVKDTGLARELWVLTLDDKRRMRVGDIQTPNLSTVEATLSPNGRWLAYRSLVNGAPAVSVQPFPTTGASIAIAETAVHPVWSPDGRTLFFNRMSTGEFFATTVTSESPFQYSTPRQLSGISSERESNSSPSNHDITPEGTFIGVIAAERGDNALKPQINIVLNWVEELRRVLPPK